MAWQAAEGKVSAVKKELHVLAAECKKAFAAGELLHSQNPQVQKAVKLCSSYTTCRTDVMKASPHMAELWKTGVGLSERMPDKKLLATSVLGASLIETLTEDISGNHLM